MEKFYKQTDFGGTHYYKVLDDTVIHVIHHNNERAFLINNLEREGFEEIVLGAFGGNPEEISEEAFDNAVKTAIFELGIFNCVKSK
jgi:hypothetical protein